jgi:predicted  nucleic acid-binding Zn-ribbon protein
MILKEFNYYLKKGTTLEEIQGSLIKKVNRWCDPFTGCVAHVYDTVLLKHWIVASDNVVGLYKLDKNILLFNDFQMIYDRLDKIEEALPKDDEKEDIIDRLDKVEGDLSNIQNEINDKKDELTHQEKLKEQLEQEIAQLDKKIEEAKARGEDTTELEKQKEEKEKELASVTQNITNITNEITNLEQIINNLLGQKDDIEKELEEHKPKEMAEKEYVDKRDNYILGQLESLIPKDPNRDSKKEEIENTDNSITSKEEELENKREEIEEQKELAKNLADEIARLKEEIRRAKERGEDTTELEKELASKEKELANTNSNISNLEKERDEIKKELADLKGLKEELEKELDNIKPPEMVTIATNQTITGSKTFNKTTIFNGAITSTGANTFSGNNTFNTGQTTFNTKAPISNVAPTNSNHLTTKSYVDNSTGADKVVFMNIADNSNEAEALKGKISTKQVFDEWLRYGTQYVNQIGELNNAKALEEIKSFTYDGTNDQILTNVNSVSWIYFLNPTPTDNFTLEVDCTGPKQGDPVWTDDDFFIINLASIVENGEHFRLDAQRKIQNASNTLARWQLVYSWGKHHTNNGKANTATSTILIHKNPYVQDTTREPYRPHGWHEGVWKLKAKRTGKKFEAWTSFMNQGYDNNTYMSWTLPATKPSNIPDKPWEMLQRMCNSKALMGIGNNSQNGKFKIVNQTNVIDMKIYDLSTNTVLTKNPTTGAWSGSVMGNNVFPNNTLVSSKLNNKLYYCTNGTLKLLISGAGAGGDKGVQTFSDIWGGNMAYNVRYKNTFSSTLYVLCTIYTSFKSNTGAVIGVVSRDDLTAIEPAWDGHADDCNNINSMCVPVPPGCSFYTRNIGNPTIIM